MLRATNARPKTREPAKRSKQTRWSPNGRARRAARTLGDRPGAAGQQRHQPAADFVAELPKLHAHSAC
eukprot:732819-Lingulodinium_polyedra.AAC.1